MPKPDTSRISSMKFMQRKDESNQREKLEILRKQREQESQWTTHADISSEVSKRARFQEMGELSGVNSAALYSEKTVLNTAVPSRQSEITQKEVVEFRDEICKLRMGRRTFGGFNPVLEKVAQELGAEKRSGEALVDGVNIDEASLVLSNNMRARKQREKEMHDRTFRSQAKANRSNVQRKRVVNACPDATSVLTNTPKLSQNGRFMAADSDSDADMDLSVHDVSLKTVKQEKKRKSSS